MNREQYLALHRQYCDRMVEITAKKNHDYSKSEDPFANFKVIESFGIATEIGFVTRMSDKLSRLSNFVTQGELKVKDESVEDTLLDLANYCLLMAGYLKAKQEKKG